MQPRPKLTPDQTRVLGERLSKLFPESEWTPEQYDLFRTRVSAYTHASAIEGFDDYRAACRYRTPVLADLLKAVANRQAPFEQSKQATEIDRMRDSERAYRATKERESHVSRTLHIPELLELGEARVLAERDDLIARMGYADNFSQRNVAGCPTWAELIDPDDERARILCWRYWIIVDSFDAYEPETANV